MALLNLVLALASLVVSAAAAWAVPVEVSEEALAHSPMVRFPALHSEQVPTKTLEPELAIRCRLVH